MQRLVTVFVNKFINTPKDDIVNFRYKWARHMMKLTKHKNKAHPRGKALHFLEFMQYLTIDKSSTFQEHWKPIYLLCHPCIINYDYIGKLETLEEDSNNILKNIEAPNNIKFPLADESTRDSKNNVFFSLMNKIDAELQEKVEKVYSTDFELFGYNRTI